MLANARNSEISKMLKMVGWQTQARVRLKTGRRFLDPLPLPLDSQTDRKTS